MSERVILAPREGTQSGHDDEVLQAMGDDGPDTARVVPYAGGASPALTVQTASQQNSRAQVPLR